MTSLRVDRGANARSEPVLSLPPLKTGPSTTNARARTESGVVPRRPTLPDAPAGQVPQGADNAVDPWADVDEAGWLLKVAKARVAAAEAEEAEWRKKLAVLRTLQADPRPVGQARSVRPPRPARPPLSAIPRSAANGVQDVLLSASARAVPPPLPMAVVPRLSQRGPDNQTAAPSSDAEEERAWATLRERALARDEEAWDALIAKARASMAPVAPRATQPPRPPKPRSATPPPLPKRAVRAPTLALAPPPPADPFAPVIPFVVQRPVVVAWPPVARAARG
jgi:hypothetical protein